MITKKQIENILKTIPDPELGISIWDLGLIYEIKIDNIQGIVTIMMTLTSIGCPLFSMMEEPIREKISKLKGVNQVFIDLTFEPPWTTDRISQTAKDQLGFLL